MAANLRYECTGPNHEGSRLTKRELLTVKKVNFLEIGVNGKTVRTRTDSWLCPACLVRDEHWNKPRYDAPGMRNAGESPVLTPIAGDDSVIGVGEGTT